MAVTAYLRFSEPAIAGDSTDPAQAGAMELLSWHHAFNPPSSGVSSGNGPVEQARHSDFSFVKYVDGATDDLLRLCLGGERIGRVGLSCYRSDGDAAPLLYLQVDLEEVIISNVSIGGGQGDRPTETISLAYAKVTYRYSAPKIV